ncbi:hypothetical protein [Calidifontibacter terrae]
MTRTVDRFEGRILGAGSTSGVRVVVGLWDHSPLGSFADVMLADANHRRLLLAPNPEVADYVALTYQFDEVVIGHVAVDAGEQKWRVQAPDLDVVFDLGGRTPTGRFLGLLPRSVATSRALAIVADPVARRIHPGVRTVGSAGNGRREFYGAIDQRAVVGLRGSWHGADLGQLAKVWPPPDFGFSSTPASPSVTTVTTTVTVDGNS